jgi:hypothetical protein
MRHSTILPSRSMVVRRGASGSVWYASRMSDARVAICGAVPVHFDVFDQLRLIRFRFVAGVCDPGADFRRKLRPHRGRLQLRTSPIWD